MLRKTPQKLERPLEVFFQEFFTGTSLTVHSVHINLSREQFNEQSFIIFRLKCQNNLSISLKITCTEQIIQNEDDISDIDDAEQHNDSFKSSPGKQIIF